MVETKQQRYARIMHNKKTEYIGRYTVQEFGHCKAQLYNHKGQAYGGDLTHRQVEDICRYVAKNDWPAERAEVYTRAAEQVPEQLPYLRYYDEVQKIFDGLRHGWTFHRVWAQLPKKVMDEMARQLGEDPAKNFLMEV